MSKQIDLGPVLPILKGDWVSGTAYERLNIVRYNSAAWVCNVNVIPTDDIELPPGTANDAGKQNWVVLAEDTSAVASVNGATGHVIINTVETPSNDSNNESIANTAWVRDRIDEAVGAVSDDTTVALAGISASLDNKLDKSGGTMTGALRINANNNMVVYTDDTINGYKYILMQAGDWDAGSRIQLMREDSPKDAGDIVICGGTTNLRVSPTNGVLVNNNPVLTSAGGTVNGELKVTPSSQNGTNAILANRDDAYVQYCGSSAWANGAVCTLHGKSYSIKPGWLELRASDGTNAASLVLKPDGSLLRSGSPVAVFASNRLVFPNNTQFWIA